VNGADVQVFEYEDAAAREAESAQGSPNGSSVGTTMITWIDRPYFFTRGRLIVLYAASDPSIVDLLTEVLGPAITSPGY
jgi:hypothetical protein